MLVSFELTMPNRGSWNGRWSGEDRKYFVIKKFSKRFIDETEHFKTLVKTGRDGWYYRWEDGWGASISVEVIDSKEAAKRRKISAGFCGYEWMINSIIQRGEIKASHELVNS
jgi:hypothetical protein